MPGWETVARSTSNYLLQIMINAPKMGLKSLVRAYDTESVHVKTRGKVNIYVKFWDFLSFATR